MRKTLAYLKTLFLSSDQNEIWKFMKQAYDLDELALSMVMNGYFEAEPMVVIPKDIEFSENQENEYNNYKKNPNSQYIVFTKLSEDLNKIILFCSNSTTVFRNRDNVLGFLSV